MNRLAVLGIGCVLALAPSVASAALRIVLPNKQGAEGLLPGQNSYDIFVDPTDNENESLYTYNLPVLLTKNGSGTLTGAGFATPYVRNPKDNPSPYGADFVFDPAQTDLVVSDNPAPTPGALSFAMINNGNLPDVTGRKKLGTIVLNVDPTALGSVYTLRLNSSKVEFGNGLTGDAITADSTGIATLEVVPEPASLSLLAIGGLLALRRRRTA
jgi:PEP-CTERM motif-containing protein